MFLRQNGIFGAWKAGVLLAFLLMSPLVFCAQSTVLFEENFENGSGIFFIDNDYGIGNGLWHVSSSCKVSLAGHTQGAALYYGWDESCDYDIGIANRGVVESPPIDLTNYGSGPIELRFKYYLEVEPGNCRWSGEVDIASVEISANGSTYHRIAKNLDLSDPQNICWGEDGLVYLDPQTVGWTECVVDISDYAGSTVQLRFGFDTVSSWYNNFDGFYVDDVIVYGPPCNYTITGDMNHDCVVDMFDFMAMSDNAALDDLAAIAANWLLNCHLTPEDGRCE